MVQFIQRLLIKFGLHLGAAGSHHRFIAESALRDRERRLAILLLATKAEYTDFKALSQQLRGQLFQDYMALLLARLRQDMSGQAPKNSHSTGWFVEVGAADGQQHSNTYFLEDMHGWAGVLIEPNPTLFRQLQVNRPLAKLEPRAVGRGTDERHFVLADQFSTFKELKDSDLHSKRRRGKRVTKVPTATLTEILRNAAAPTYIDLLSIDTEGSELEVLDSLDWDSYDFGFIAIEHNFKKGYVEEICKLVGGKGYVRVAPNFSEFDVWFVNGRFSKILLKRFPDLVSL